MGDSVAGSGGRGTGKDRRPWQPGCASRNRDAGRMRPMDERIRLLIADDHALFRQGLKSLLQLQPEFEVIGEVHSAADLTIMLENAPCDIVLLDLQMDKWMGDEIDTIASRAKVIVLTASERVEDALAVIRKGARAVVQKRFAVET